MAEIIVGFNNTTNSYYKSYAKLIYSISYSDNVSSLTSTATINVDFYIKPDSYTYTTYTKDTLYLGIRKASSTAALTKTTISPTETYGGKVSSNTYNLVGSTSFSVTYTSTSTYSVYLAAGYTNEDTTRFAPFYLPQTDGGTYYEYDFESTITNAVTLEKRISNTACTAPTTVLVLPTIFSDTVSISWSGAASGTSNTISSYYIQYRTSTDASSWGSWAALATVTSTATSGSYSYSPSISSGVYIQYQVQTRGSAGSSWYSGYTISSNYTRKNTVPEQISSVNLSSTLLYEDETLTVSWSAPTDIDGNIAYYDVDYSINSGSWVDYRTMATTTFTYTPSGLSDGDTIKFRVCAIDALSGYGSYKESSAVTYEEYSGIKVCSNGSYTKMLLYVCIDGSYQKAQVYVCDGSTYKKGVN